MKFSSESFCAKCFYVGAVALIIVHYLAAVYLPISDSDETFNFIEPIHFLLYGTGKQTWENCSEYCLRNWVFTILYASPAFLRYRVLPAVVTAASNWCRGVLGHTGGGVLSSASAMHLWYVWATEEPRSVDIYFFQRICYGQVACLAELFFVSSLWASYGSSARHVPLIALWLLVTSSVVPHAGVSVLPTSFAMISLFVALGCWLRSGVVAWNATGESSSETEAVEEEKQQERRGGGRVQKSFSVASAAVVPPQVLQAPSTMAPLFAIATVIIVVVVVLVGWPFAGLVAVPMLLDLLLRYPDLTILTGVASTLITGCIVYFVDSIFFCRKAFSAWNIVVYNVLGGGDATLYGVEPWIYFYKNLLVNFHFVFLLALASPLVVLLGRRQPPHFLRLTLGHTLRHPAGKKYMEVALLRRYYTPFHSRVSELAYISTFFIWFLFWHSPPHKEERFMAPAYPSLIFAATLTLSRLVVRSAAGDSAEAEATQLRRAWRAASLAAKAAAKKSTPPRHKIVISEAETNDSVDDENPQEPSQWKKNKTSSVKEGSNTTIRRRRRMDRAPTCSSSEMDETDEKNSHAESDLAPSGDAIPSALRKRQQRHRGGIPSTYRYMILVVFFLLTGTLSWSRAAALHHFYSGPQRLLYDAYPMLSRAAKAKWERTVNTAATPSSSAAAPIFQLCVGREWYRFPSSFFLDHYVPPPFPTTISKEENDGKLTLSYYEYESNEFPAQPIAKYGFIKTTAFNGALPLDFFRHSPHVTGLLNRSSFMTAHDNDDVFTFPLRDALIPNPRLIPKACVCASALVNDLNLPIEEQYVTDPTRTCDAVLDSFHSARGPERTREEVEVSLDAFPQSFVDPLRYRLLDTSRTPTWCRVLYYPFGVTEKCAVWRDLLLQGKEG